MPKFTRTLRVAVLEAAIPAECPQCITDVHTAAASLGLFASTGIRRSSAQSGAGRNFSTKLAEERERVHRWLGLLKTGPKKFLHDLDLVFQNFKSYRRHSGARPKAENPKSITPVCGYGFRARRCAAPRNDEARQFQ